jgi:hypothetical protein
MGMLHFHEVQGAGVRLENSAGFEAMGMASGLTHYDHVSLPSVQGSDWKLGWLDKDH